jgi:hypothetical protein
MLGVPPRWVDGLERRGEESKELTGVLDDRAFLDLSLQL